MMKVIQVQLTTRNFDPEGASVPERERAPTLFALLFKETTLHENAICHHSYCVYLLLEALLPRLCAGFLHLLADCGESISFDFGLLVLEFAF